MTRVSVYVGRVFVTRFALIVGGMTALAALFEFLARGDDVIRDTGGDALAVASYVALRLPAILASLGPLSLLVAAVLTLSALARSSELSALRASGVSQWRLAAALAPAAAVAAIGLFLLGDRAAPAAEAALKTWAVGDYRIDRDDANAGFVWARIEGDIARFRVSPGGDVLTDVTVFVRDADGVIARVIDAPRAVAAPASGEAPATWRLEGARGFSPGGGPATSAKDEIRAADFDPRTAAALSVHPRDLAMEELVALTGEGGRGAYPSFLYVLWLNRKLAVLVGAVTLALAAAPIAIAFDRRGGALAMIVTGILVGFAYMVVDGTLVALGEAGVIHPMAGAWGATLLLAAGALSLGMRNERLVGAGRRA